MITALSLNAALALPVRLEGSGPADADGQMALGEPFVACKAINALRSVKALGAAGERGLVSVGGETGERIEQRLRGLPCVLLHRQAANRRTLVVSHAGRQWEWKTSVHLGRRDLDATVHDLERCLRPKEVVILSGTPPALAPGLTWNPLFDLLESKHARLVLDSALWRTLMTQGARPWILKINRAEWGSDATRADALVEEMRAFRSEWGMNAVIVTAGVEGAWAVGDSGAWHVVCEETPPGHHFIGCGDAFAGGLCVALDGAEPLPGALVQATACAFQNLATPLPGEVQLKAVLHCRSRVRLTGL